MAFASIFIPNFMVQAVVRSEPNLRDRALVLMEGTASTRSVIALNAAAAKAGIQLRMTKLQAQQFGEIEFRDRAPAQENIAHAALLDLGWSISPRVEDTAGDTIVLDLSGLASLFGSDANIAAKLAEGATRLGFSTQIAAASNPDAAIIASRAFTGITVIPHGKEASILGKVPVAALAPSTEILETLDRWGVHTCAALAALPVLQLSERLGQEGVRLRELARARSSRTLVLAQPAIYFEEKLELEHAEAELEPLTFLLGRLLEALCTRLAERSLAASIMHVRFELEASFEKDIRLLNDHSRSSPAPKIYERTLRLAVPTGNSQLLLKLLVLNLQADAPSAPVKKMTLAAEAARPRVTQGGLFSKISPDPEKVELTVARLVKLVGAGNVGSPELLDTHRPEGFRMRRFVPLLKAANTRRPGRGSSPDRISATNACTEDLQSKSLRTAFRVFRPALPAKVEIRHGCPAWVSFNGMRGQVVAASGPWRGSGDWWKEDAWQSDEWDIEIQVESGSHSRRMKELSDLDPKPLRAVYRVFYDPLGKEWFVRGAYD